jgi:D-serine deaminase-like pyridoxal phosphate-dependent protein
MSFSQSDSPYRVDDLSRLLSPSLLLFRELLNQNLDSMIAMAGSPDRLRPHCKTHKMAEVTRIELAKGIRKHKCATFAEAEMLAGAGVKDVFLAYNPVGPNIERAVQFLRRFPDVTFSVTADHPQAITALSQAMAAPGQTIDVLLDVDIGFRRTGIAPGDAAVGLYRQLANSPGLRPGGLHAYDGHYHQPSRSEREQAVEAEWQIVRAFRDRLVKEGLPVPRIVVGGTPTFPVHAANRDPGIDRPRHLRFERRRLRRVVRRHEIRAGSRAADSRGEPSCCRSAYRRFRNKVGRDGSPLWATARDPRPSRRPAGRPQRGTSGARDAPR